MNYLTRPVFEFEVDWSNPINRSFSFDLRELLLGFGAEFFTTLQSHVAQGWSVSLTLATPAEMEAYEAFTEALNGRLNGFWLPTPMEAMQVVSVVDATHFDIADQGLRSSWNTRPDIHLWLEGQPCKITAVTLQAPGVERVTVDAALAPTVAIGTIINRLHYVRLADDVERGVSLKEGAARIGLRVVELPHEYATFETGEKPIYLYHFWADAPIDVHWRYTSFAADVVSDNKLFSKFPITHGTLKDTVRIETRTVDVKAKYDPNHPFALFLPIPFSRPLNVEISRAEYSDPDSVTMLFTGQVRKVNDNGDSLTAQCDDWRSILSRKFPRFQITSECNNQLYDSRTCKVMRYAFDTTATIVEITAATNPQQVTVELMFTASLQFPKWTSENWFANGVLATGVDAEFELRTILTSVVTDTDKLVLQLNAPLVHAANDQLVVISPGCDGLAVTCREKFNNLVNFGGFVAVPEKNLSLESLADTTAQGNKK